MSKKKQKAILVVSFGTSFEEARKKNIDSIEADISTAFPEYQIYHAWTSKVIIRKIMKRDGVKVPTVEEAMAQMFADGMTQVIVQPTHILNGIENDIMKEEVLKFSASFEKIAFGMPLLSNTEDIQKAIQAVMKEFVGLRQEEALVFMGHGTEHYANFVYGALDYTFKDMGYSNVFIGTVEAYPNLDTVLKLLEKLCPKKVFLAPFMVVAGEHATHDMAGEEEDSWKNRLEQAGYEVECVMKGLGEYLEIRNLYVEHIRAVEE